MIFQVADGVRLLCEFYDASDVAADPTTVTLLLESPSGVVTTLTDGAGDLTKGGVGVYYYDLLIDEAGMWHWRWIGTGTVQQAEQGRFWVEPENVEE